MSDRRVEDAQLSSIEYAVVAQAMAALELVLKADSLGLIAQDDGGVFIVPRPGVSVELFRLLAEVDWRAEILIAEEHFA